MKLRLFALFAIALIAGLGVGYIAYDTIGGAVPMGFAAMLAVLIGEMAGAIVWRWEEVRK